jgi:hypothetical protein
MSAEKTATFRIDAHSLRLAQLPGAPPAALPLAVSLALPRRPPPFAASPASPVVRFTIRQEGDATLRIDFPDAAIAISTDNMDELRRWFDADCAQFVGLFAAVRLLGENEDFFWAAGAADGGVRILAVRGGRDLARGEFVLADADRATAAIRRMFFRTRTGGPAERSRRLSIKLSWRHLSAMQFFEADTDATIDWLLTDKTFLQNALERLRLDRELAEFDILRRHVVVILNTYRNFNSDCHAGARLVRIMFSALGDARPPSLVAPCRHFLENPTKSEILTTLRDKDTHYVFGGFHVPPRSRAWEMGRPFVSPQLPEFVDFSELAALDLRHLKLLRVFQRTPLDSDPGASLAAALLRAGAQRVEGSLFTENHLEHLRSLLRVAMNSPGLQSHVRRRCLENGMDFDQLRAETTRFVECRS